MRVLCLIACLFIAVCFEARAQPSTQTSDAAFCQQVEKETFRLVNQYRKENDFPPLAWDDEIAETARIHSRDMATGKVDFGHDGFDDRISHLKKSLHDIWGAGENVLFTSEPDDVAQSALTMWLHSPHHLKNIRGEFNYSGLGVWRNKEGTIYFTQIFVRVKAPTTETTTDSSSPDRTSLGPFAVPLTRSVH